MSILDKSDITTLAEFFRVANKGNFRTETVLEDMDLSEEAVNDLLTKVEECLKEDRPVSNCEFVSVWGGGTEIHTPGVYDPQTGEVYSLESLDVEPEGGLEYEKVILDEDSRGNREELLVCSECHSYVMKPKMVSDSVGDGLSEVSMCMDPECPSNTDK